MPELPQLRHPVRLQILDSARHPHGDESGKKKRSEAITKDARRRAHSNEYLPSFLPSLSLIADAGASPGLRGYYSIDCGRFFEVAY